MGSIGRLFTVDAEHIRAQSKVDAGRITQAAYNRNQISLADARTLLQTANNAAAKDWAAAQASIRDANNYATTVLTKGQNALIDGQNALNIKTTDVYNRTQQGIAESNTATSAGVAGATKAVQDFRNATAVDIALAQRRVQEARNERAASESTLARWSQSVANQHLLDEAGDKITAIQEDAARRADQALVGGITERLKGAEALGASLAQAGAAGLGGASIETFTQDIRLRDALRQEQEDRQIASVLYQAGQARGQTLTGAVNQMNTDHIVANMDYSAIIPEGQDFTPVWAQKFAAETQAASQNFDRSYAALDYTPFVADQDYEVIQPNLDYTVYVDHKKMSFVQKFFTVGAAGAATYFGGPQAGAAVMDASFAAYDAKNGNFAAANQGFSNAASGLLAGYKTYQKLGSPWGESTFKSTPSSGANLKV